MQVNNKYDPVNGKILFSGLRLFHSIALRIPTAHNFTRD